MQSRARSSEKLHQGLAGEDEDVLARGVVVAFAVLVLYSTRKHQEDGASANVERRES